MATKKATAASNETITIMEIVQGEMDFCILGTSPLICNRMSNKVTRELLLPKGKMTQADKAANLKHNPLQEFRDSPYTLDDSKAKTLLAVLPTMFKGAMGTAALDMPGTKRTQIDRLVSVDGARIPVYGIPQIMMAVTRSADINRTPDVRTRAIIPEWACHLTLKFVKPALREQAIANLLAAAGIVSGIGDWRQEKGSGNHGLFKLVSPTDKDFKRIVEKGGRDAQIKAMGNPEPYDDETSEMLSWYDIEVRRRGFKVAA